MSVDKLIFELRGKFNQINFRKKNALKIFKICFITFKLIWYPEYLQDLGRLLNSEARQAFP